METLEQCVESFQVNNNNHSGIFIVNFEQISYIHKKQNKTLKNCSSMVKKYL